jgi:hypothetical protein
MKESAMESPSVQAEAASAPATASDKAADFENFLFEGEEPENEDEVPADSDGEADDADLDLEEEEAGEGEDEPETPAIAPPSSLNAEEKKAFAAASPEAQQAWAAAETRRNAQVQEATTKAAERERAAVTAVEQADAKAMQNYAAQLEEVGKAFAPDEPQRSWYPDDLSYLTACRTYDQQLAQHTEFMQQVSGLKAQAQGRAAEIDMAQRASDLLTVPKLADPSTRDDYLKSSLGLVQELGLDPQAFEQVAGSEDFLALERIAEWKSKAETLDKARARQMQKVRAAKGKSLRPNAAPQDSRAARGGQDWQRVKSARSKEAQAEAFADYMGL